MRVRLYSMVPRVHKIESPLPPQAKFQKGHSTAFTGTSQLLLAAERMHALSGLDGCS